jgi:hypothetical protein
MMVVTMLIMQDGVNRLEVGGSAMQETVDKIAGGIAKTQEMLELLVQGRESSGRAPSRSSSAVAPKELVEEVHEVEEVQEERRNPENPDEVVCFIRF